MRKLEAMMLSNKISRTLKLYEDFNAKIATYDRINNSDIFLLFTFLALRYKQLIQSYFQEHHQGESDFILKKIETEMLATENLANSEFIQLKNFKFHTSPSSFNNVIKKVFRYYSDSLETITTNLSKLIKIGEWVKEKEGCNALLSLKDDLFQLLTNNKKELNEALLFNDLILELASKVNREQFSTHKELNSIIANLAKQQGAHSIYDPACGAGSLLIEAAVNSEDEIVLYGQDNEEKLVLFAKLNSILAGVEAHLTVGDSFQNDNRRHTKVDLVISEPPLFSKDIAKLDQTVLREEKEEYSLGKSDLLSSDEIFILNMSRRLKAEGLMLLILPHSVLYKEGDAQLYRKEIVSHYNSLDAIIVPSLKEGKKVLSNFVILIYKPSRNIYHQETKTLTKLISDIFIINDFNGSELTSQEISTLYFERKEVLGISKIVSQAEIEANDYNFNTSLYLHEKRAKGLAFAELKAEIKKVEEELKKVQALLESALQGIMC